MVVFYSHPSCSTVKVMMGCML